MIADSKIIDDLLTKICEIFVETEDETEFDLLCEDLLKTHSTTTKEAVFDLFGRMFNSDSILE
jgi:phosphate uptake regulator